MKKHYLIKKIISIIFIVLLLIFTPITGFINGKSAFVYAATLDIMQGASELLAPVAGYLCYQYENVSDTLNSIDLSSTINRVKESIPNVYPRLSNESKFIIASLTTTLSVQDINYTLGTNYSDATISTFGIETLKLKMANNEPLTLWDMQKLGVNDMTAYNIKNNLYGNIDNVNQVVGTLNGYNVLKRIVDGFNINYLDMTSKKDVLWNYIPASVKGSQHLSYSSTGGMASINSISTYYLNISGQYFKIQNCLKLGSSTQLSSSTISATTVAGSSSVQWYNRYPNQYIKLFSMENGSWVSIYEKISPENADGLTIKRNLLNTLGSSTGIDFTTTSLYISSLYLYDYLDVTFDGDNINVGNPDKAFTVLAPTAGVFQEYNVSDTSVTQAEKVIGNIDAQANPTDLNYEVKAYENNDTNQKEVTLIPQADGVPYSDTGANATDYPDTTGDTNVNPDTGQGSLNIPILGTLLLWLQKIWQALRDILQTVFDGFNKPSSLDEGIDWGNFKGLFDIFYIFYYLIIIVIMILLKFLAVVFNMLSIPPNSSLFANYPTMLSGLNYIKNIKVGGFNITLQQIFEYMFTVFFFLFIVTTLQKLYHSFAGIERQTINQEQKWDSNSNVIYRDGNYINTKTGEIQDYKYK